MSVRVAKLMFCIPAVAWVAFLLASSAHGSDGSCDFGFVRRMKDDAPACISACPEVCAPLAKAAASWVLGGDPVPKLCQAKASFKCLVRKDNNNTCAQLMDKVQDLFGIELPRSDALMDKACAECAERCDKSALSTTAAPSANVSSCDVGFMRRIRHYAPECIGACPHVCASMAKAAAVYMSNGDPIPHICNASTEFKCLISKKNNITCGKLLDKVRDLVGITVPRTDVALNKTCSGCPEHCGMSVLPQTASANLLQQDSSCNVGFVKAITRYAPDCIAACPDVCGPLRKAVVAWMSKKEVMPKICEAITDFKCLISVANSNTCARLLNKAQSLLGINVPRVQTALDKACIKSNVLGANPIDIDVTNQTSTTRVNYGMPSGGHRVCSAMAYVVTLLFSVVALIAEVA